MVAVPAGPEREFAIKRGFKINLVASDPLVASPVAMAFDEDSRLYVAEMRDYPAGRDQTPHLGQITILEDPAGEGVFTSSTVFATNLPLPSAIVCYGGGVLVAAAPDILYLQDTNGNGVADIRKVVFTGFGSTNSPDPDGLPHSFYWGVDNRIYGATGGNGGSVSPPQGGVEPLLLTGLDFSIDPREDTFAPETGAALTGMTRDDWGRRFLTSSARPLSVEMIEYRFLQRNPFVAPAPLVDVVEGPAVAVFRHTPSAPAPVKATRTNAPGPLALTSIELAPVKQTNAFTASWMTKARGSVIYRGNLFPPNYRGSAFIADPDAHIVHHAVLRETGLGVRAERDPDERDTEFLVASGTGFKPTQIVNGPDGALYIGDMWKGGNSGRIWRVAPVGFRPGTLPRMSEASTYQLVSNLAHTNGWHRDTASRLLFERPDPNATRLLGSMLTGSRLAIARIHAMYALAGMGEIQEGQLALLLGDPDPHVRRHAVRLAEGFVRDRQVSDLLWSRLRVLTADRDPQVRFQLALSAGSIFRPDKASVLMGALGRDVADPWMQTAVLNSGLEGSATLLSAAAANSRLRGQVGAAFLVTLTDMIGVTGYQPEITGALDFLEKSPLELGPAFGLVGALGDGLRRTRSSLALVDPNGRLKKYYVPALLAAGDPGVNQDVRIDAIRVLGVGPFTMADGGAALLGLLGAGDNAAIQTAALQALENYTDSTLVPLMAQRWNSIPRPLRSQAVTTLLARTDRIPAVIALLQSGGLPPGDLLPWHINLLRSSRDPGVRSRATAIFGAPTHDRGPELARLEPALKRAGNPNMGRQVFESRCAVCHTIWGGNLMPGPDLAGIKVRGKGWILQALVAPSADLAPDCKTAVIETMGGETLLGTLDREDRGAVLLRRPGRKVASIPRDNVSTLQVQSWSLMSDGVTQGLTEQNVTDLLQFLLSVP